MAALVVITLLSVFSRSAAAIAGSVITVSSAILLFPSLRWFRFSCLLLAWLRLAGLRRFPRLRTRHRADFHNQSLDIVQFGIQVVQAHLDVGHALGNRDYVSLGRHGQLLERFEHRLFDSFAEWSGNRHVGVEHRARGLRIGFAVHHVNHGLAPGIHIDVARRPPGFHRIKPLTIVGWVFRHFTTPFSTIHQSQLRGYPAGCFVTPGWHPWRLHVLNSTTVSSWQWQTAGKRCSETTFALRSQRAPRAGTCRRSQLPGLLSRRTASWWTQKRPCSAR